MIHCFSIYTQNIEMFNENTAENFSKIKLPVKLGVLALQFIPDTFDFEHFSKFLQVSNVRLSE